MSKSSHSSALPPCETPGLKIGVRSHVGMVRARNEDALHADPDLQFAVLADGMGGYHGGDVAAALAVEAVIAALTAGLPEQTSPEGVARLALDATRDANRSIYFAGELDPTVAGMGCTLVLAVFIDGEVVSAHVGDSRLYRMRQGQLKLLTRDHTMLQEQVDLGIIDEDEARGYTYRGLLTRGLGVADEVVPDLGFHEACPGDVFLLCSDGLTDMLDDEAIAILLSLDRSPEEIASRLVDCANQLGGRDNVSVIVVRLQG